MDDKHNISENIKIKEKKPLKSQSEQPQFEKQSIDLNDVYAHLKRQPWHYTEHKEQKQSEELTCTTDTNNNADSETAGSNGWKSYLSQICQHINNLKDMEFEPGSINEAKSLSDDDESEEMIKSGITLMGDYDINEKDIQFKKISKCSKEDIGTLSDHSDSEDCFIKSSVMTMMGHETTE